MCTSDAKSAKMMYALKRRISQLSFRTLLHSSQLKQSRYFGSFRVEEMPYEAVKLSSSGEPFKEKEFGEKLLSYEKLFKGQGKSSLWLFLENSETALAQVALERGFEFHHCGPTSLMMNKWLKSSESKIPPYATHQVRRLTFPALNPL